MPEQRRTLTVFHVRRDIAGTQVKDYGQVLQDLDALDSYDISDDVNVAFQARLFVEQSESRLPSWAEFLADGFGELPLPDVPRVNAVLIVKVNYSRRDHFFAFTFGHGRYLLRADSYDRNYGLRVALNVMYDASSGAIEPNRLRSVDSKTVAANVLRTRRQTDRRTNFEAFGVDIQRDLLRAVTGLPIESEPWGSRISGADSFTANPTINFDGLGEFCKHILRAHRRESYQESFGWIDNLHTVTDPHLLNGLQDALIRDINTRGAIELAVPDIVEWTGIAHLRFSFDQERTFTDPEDADLVDSLTKSDKLGELSVERLKKFWRLEAIDGSGEVISKWPLLRCLSGEIELDNRAFILSEGDFFEIRREFLGELDAFISALQETKHELPTSPGDIEEGDYNELAAKSSPSFLLLDKRTVTVSGMTTPIEICDVLTSDGSFIHVKRKLGSSSLSHLFAQGTVSADLFLMSREYRAATLARIQTEEKARANAAKDERFLGRFSKLADLEGISSSKYEVVYAIVAKWAGRSLAKALPFFSKVNLRRHVEDLHRMGYRVTTARVEIGTAPSRGGLSHTRETRPK